MVTTAIAVYTSEGCVGRCDARCHGATSKECDCICGGRLHGCGVDNAIGLNTELFLGARPEDLGRQWAADHGLEPVRVRVAALEQGALW